MEVYCCKTRANTAAMAGTATETISGTPLYIAPERIKGKDLTPTSDLYAVGLIAHELLIGARDLAVVVRQQARRAVLDGVLHLHHDECLTRIAEPRVVP